MTAAQKPKSKMTTESQNKITEAAKDLHAAFYAMRLDWKDGDFDLPPLARIHMEAMESKAIELGRLISEESN